MNEKAVKHLAYVTAPLLTIALVAGVAAAASPSEEVSQTKQHPKITSEQKDVLDQARELRQSGDEEGARALLENVGWSKGEMMGRMDGFPGKGERPSAGEMEAHHEAVKTALEAGDYDAFVLAMADAPFADKVDEAFFAKMQEAHAHLTQARSIFESLGVETFGHMMHHR